MYTRPFVCVCVCASDLLAHGHGSGLFVRVQLHRLHGGGSLTVETTLIQDGVEHLEEAQREIVTRSLVRKYFVIFASLNGSKHHLTLSKRDLTCNTVGTVSSKSM